MLNVLLIANNGENYGIASRIKREGHIVKFYSTEELTPSSSKEVTILSKWESGIQAADLVLLLSPGFGRVLQFMDDGRRIFGCGALEDVLLKNPELAMNFLNLATTGEVQEGFGVTVGGWFSNQEFRLTYYVVHSRYLMERDKGPEVVGMGCVVVPALKEDPLVKETLEKLKGVLGSMNFCGQIELDVLINEKNIMTMNVTSKFRNGILQVLCENWSKTFANTLYQLPQEELELRTPYAMSLGLSQPPWPYHVPEVNYNCKLEMIEPAVKHTWCSRDKNFLGYITSRGITYSEVRRRVFRTVNNIVKDSTIQYRVDIGNGVDVLMKQLEEWKLIKGGNNGNTEDQSSVG